jgi:hypothetical protein
MARTIDTARPVSGAPASYSPGDTIAFASLASGAPAARRASVRCRARDLDAAARWVACVLALPGEPERDVLRAGARREGGGR